MRFLQRLFIIGLFFFLCSGFAGWQQGTSVIVTGKVIADATGIPVANVHVYILEGEEETLTNSNGEFKIQSWQKTPLKLTVTNYKNYQKTSVVVRDPSQIQLIRLKIK